MSLDVHNGCCVGCTWDVWCRLDRVKTQPYLGCPVQQTAFHPSQVWFNAGLLYGMPEISWDHDEDGLKTSKEQVKDIYVVMGLNRKQAHKNVRRISHSIQQKPSCKGDLLLSSCKGFCKCISFILSIYTESMASNCSPHSHIILVIMYAFLWHLVK